MWYYSRMCKAVHERYMREALAEARAAAMAGEVPVGAVVVLDGEIVGRGRNSTEADRDPTCHAEMNALRDASKRLGRLRLTGCDLYVSCEPCAMCAGAIVLARIERLFVGTPDPKAGACGSLRNVVCDERLNHRVELVSGVLQEECAAELRIFFKALRSK